MGLYGSSLAKKLGQDVDRFFKADVCQEEFGFQDFYAFLSLCQILLKLVCQTLHNRLQIALELRCQILIVSLE